MSLPSSLQNFFSGGETISCQTRSVRASASRLARKEMRPFLDRMRLQRTLRQNILPSACITYQLKNEFLVSRKNVIANRIEDCMRPFIIVSVKFDMKRAQIRAGACHKTTFAYHRSSHKSTQDPYLPLSQLSFQIFFANFAPRHIKYKMSRPHRIRS